MGRLLLVLGAVVWAGCGGESAPAGSSPAPSLSSSGGTSHADDVGSHPKAELASEPDPMEAARLSPEEPGVLRHVGRRFELRYPPDWNVVRVIDEGNVSYYVTPEQETHPRRMAVALKVNVSRLPAQSKLRGQRAVDLVEHHLPTTRAQNPGLEQQGEVQSGKLGGHDAGTAELRGTLEPRRGRYRIVFHMAQVANDQIYTSAFAPEADFDRYAETFEKIRTESRFGRTSLVRRSESYEARHIVERHKAATVSVVVMEKGRDRSTGTGFLISPDGYLLTNWHVVVNMATGKPHTNFRVEWDPSVGRKPEPAKLVGYKVQAGLSQVHQHTRAWGTDIALLKIAPGDYPSFPLTPLADVQPGDGVVTLGFPSRGILQGLAITITRGVVTRFNRDPTGRVQSIFTDAAITHGSSGGPCVSLVTGGVIGLNTFGQPIERGARARGSDLNDLVNYFGVVPIDACLTEFPIVCDLGRSRDLADLDFMDSFELARQFQDAGSFRAATEVAAEAARRRPESPDALWLQASTRWSRAFRDAKDQGKTVSRTEVNRTIAAYEKVLARDAGHAPTLRSLAFLCMDHGRHADAVRYADQAIREDPDRWDFHNMRAWASIRQRRYEEAVRHAMTARELCANTYAEPSITAGVAHYANKDYAAGFEAYQNAAKVHPRSLRARIGVARYYEYRSQANQALAEYERILVDFPDNAQVLLRMAQTSKTADRLAEACTYFGRSIRAYESGGERPPSYAFDLYAQALQKRKQNAEGLVVTSKWLSHVGSRPGADRAHIQAQIFCRPLKLYGLADAHLRLALVTTTSAKTKSDIRRRRLTSLSLAEIETMRKLGYRSSTAIPLILRSPLKFRASTSADVTVLRKRGIPDDWILAVLASSKKTPAPKKTTTRKPTTRKTTRTPTQPKKPHALVGTWRASVRNKGVAQVLVFTFTAQGRLTVENFQGGRRIARDRGRWTVSRNVITATDSRGKRSRWNYTLAGGWLQLTLNDRGKVVFYRQRKR
ncbi:MAG: trypsin-like peptidase domain-containing protein [Planctomycetota bacterium]